MEIRRSDLKERHPLRVFPKPVVKSVWPLYNGNENSYAKTATVDPNKLLVAGSDESLAVGLSL